MPNNALHLKLLPGDSRLINASEGFTLEVQSGCLWLTRPNDHVDHFLVKGSRIALHEKLVLIQSDKVYCPTDLLPARYTLVPHQQSATSWLKRMFTHAWRIRNLCTQAITRRVAPRLG